MDYDLQVLIPKDASLAEQRTRMTELKQVQAIRDQTREIKNLAKLLAHHWSYEPDMFDAINRTSIPTAWPTPNEVIAGREKRE